ncbi:MAG: glycosyltransferase family 39 protein [Chloroflexota bacterium]
MKAHHVLLGFTLIAYVALASTYSVITPLFEVSDELWHYPMVKYIADNGDLPVQDPNNHGPWRQEGSQPPLYYMMGAALTFWIDTSDLEDVRRINPHAGIGVIHPDGNANMMVHRPELEQFPWQGTALAVHIVRFMSVVMGAGTVFVTYLLGRQLFEDWPTVAVVAAALVAFLPMFLFIHGSVNNDALSNLMGNLITLLLVWLLKRDTAPTTREYVMIGLAVGVGLLAKGSVGFMIFVVAAVLAILAVRYRDWKIFMVGGLISGVLTNVIAGWWYVRNWVLYGDPTGLNTFLAIVGERLIPANSEQLWAERHSFLNAYWGFFGGVNVALPKWTYAGFNIIGAFALLSAVVYLLYLLATRQKNGRWWLMVAVTVVWMAITFISYLRWTSITPASQGRLVFVALSSTSVWMAVGLCWLFRRWGRYFVAGGVIGYFAAVAITTPFVVIRPTYQPPPQSDYIGAMLTWFGPDDGPVPGLMAMTGAAVQRDPAQPGEYVLIETDWQVLEAFDLNWSLFVHLETQDGVIVAQRDIYPGRGLLATKDMPELFAWDNITAVDVPRTVYAPQELNVMVGWYHLPSGERMEHERDDDDSPVYTPWDRYRVKIGTITLEPRESEFDVPNPIHINFDGRLELMGYEYSTLAPVRGEAMDVTLYWRALQPLEKDYVAFVHVIDDATFTIVGGSDAQPVQWTRPTTTWEVGEIIEDRHTFVINDDTNPAIYEVEVGMYSVEEDGSLPRLRIFAEGGGQPNNFIYLNRVRVNYP